MKINSQSSNNQVQNNTRVSRDYKLPLYKRLMFWRTWTINDIQPSQNKMLNSFQTKRDKAKKKNRKKLFIYCGIILTMLGSSTAIITHFMGNHDLSSPTNTNNKNLSDTTNDDAARQILKGKTVTVHDRKLEEQQQEQEEKNNAKNLKTTVKKQQQADQKLLDKSHKSFNAIAKQNGSLQKQIKEITKNNQDLTKHNDDLNQQLKDAKNKGQNSSDLQTKLDDANHQLDQSQSQAKDYQSQAKDYQSKNEQLQKELDSLKSNSNSNSKSSSDNNSN